MQVPIPKAHCSKKVRKSASVAASYSIGSSPLFSNRRLFIAPQSSRHNLVSGFSAIQLKVRIRRFSFLLGAAAVIGLIISHVKLGIFIHRIPIISNSNRLIINRAGTTPNFLDIFSNKFISRLFSEILPEQSRCFRLTSSIFKVDYPITRIKIITKNFRFTYIYNP